MNLEEISQRIENIFKNSKFSITHLCQLTILCHFKRGPHQHSFGVLIYPDSDIEKEIIHRIEDRL